MRAIQISELGGPEVLTMAELPDPQPGPGQLLVDVTAVGVNYASAPIAGGTSVSGAPPPTSVTTSTWSPSAL